MEAEDYGTEAHHFDLTQKESCETNLPLQHLVSAVSSPWPQPKRVTIDADVMHVLARLATYVTRRRDQREGLSPAALDIQSGSTGARTETHDERTAKPSTTDSGSDTRATAQRDVGGCGARRCNPHQRHG